jgi:hypothetical protein
MAEDLDETYRKEQSQSHSGTNLPRAPVRTSHRVLFSSTTETARTSTRSRFSCKAMGNITWPSKAVHHETYEREKERRERMRERLERRTERTLHAME